jgi:16S rRNA (uracil1498-N3)-methyltransferase
MSLPLFFEENITAPGTSFALGQETAKHVVQVLRMRTGEPLQLTNGQGGMYTAEIITQDKRSCTVRILTLQQTPKPPKKISIAISLLKNASRFEWFLEKAVEIGVSEIIPLICARTERQHFRHDRMQGILVSAMLQSHQAWMPALHQPAAFETLVNSVFGGQKLIAHCGPGDKNTLPSLQHALNTTILIGPEGDFAEAEIEKAANQGFIPVTLGNTRLRTETAGIVAATLLVN